jgi:hypothetical protein
MPSDYWSLGYAVMVLSNALVHATVNMPEADSIKNDDNAEEPPL